METEAGGFTEGRWQRLLAALGERFLAYALNLQCATEVPKDISDTADSASPSPRVIAHDQLLSVLDEVDRLAEAKDNWPRSFLYRRALCDPAGGGESVVEHLRQSCGGTWLELPADDETLTALCRLGRDCFAGSLISIGTDYKWMGNLSGVSDAVRNSGSVTGFYEAWLGDSILAKLFPRAHEQRAAAHGEGFYGVRSDLIWSAGGGGTLQLVTLPEFLIGYTLTLMLLHGHLEPEYLFEQLSETLATSKSLVSKKRTKVPSVIALSNVVVPEEQQAGTPYGSLHVANEAFPSPSISMVKPTACLSKSVDLKLLEIIPYGPDEDPDVFPRRLEHRQTDIDKARREVQRERDRLRLSLVLSSDDNSVVSPVPVCYATFNPLASLTTEWPQIPSSVPFPPITMDEESVHRFRAWLERLSAHPESLWMGTRRLLSAVTSRQDPLDGLVDAVICWENMVGSKGETSFRVCAGLATLLEPDSSAARGELYRELKDLYDRRSKLVHGDDEPDYKVSSSLRDNAVRTAIRAMCRLYDQDELRDAASATKRSEMLLLGS